jgi:hypothetical protein
MRLLDVARDREWAVDAIAIQRGLERFRMNNLSISPGRGSLKVGFCDFANCSRATMPQATPSCVTSWKHAKFYHKLVSIWR